LTPPRHLIRFSGDILIHFGDKPIKNLYDFTDALRRSKVGDVVEVKVLRDGQTVTASVKLEQRKQNAGLLSS